MKVPAIKLDTVLRHTALWVAIGLGSAAWSPVRAAEAPGGASFARTVVRDFGLDDRTVSYVKTHVALTDADAKHLLDLTEGNPNAYKGYLAGFKTFVTTNRTRNVVYIARSCCGRQEWFVGRSWVSVPASIGSVAPGPVRIAGVSIGDTAARVQRLFGVARMRGARALRYEGPRPLTDPRSGCVTRYTFSLSAGRVVGMDFNNEC